MGWARRGYCRLGAGSGRTGDAVVDFNTVRIADFEAEVVGLDAWVLKNFSS